MAKDIHKEPFDEATKTKLDIFERYLIEWLPVFIKNRYAKNVMICDFFAGEGQDSKGVAGSPLRILKTIEVFREIILNEQIRIQVILNEISQEKVDKLKSKVTSTFDLHSWHNKVDISYRKEDFQDLFLELHARLQKQTNLLFIDQYGIKHVTGDTFQKLIALRQTDFLFFLSSSFIKRFGTTTEFKEHFPDLDPTIIANTKPEDIHRVMLDYYRDKIPAGNKTKLYPFTIKKGPNIYGLIFGSEHPLGVEKFLDIAWKENELNGEANFDIDNDITKKRAQQQLLLFEEMKEEEHKPTKKDLFKYRLEKFILQRNKVTNRDIYFFTLSQGHPKSHAKEYITSLRNEEKIDCPKQVGFSYNSCVKGNPELKYIKAKTNG